MSSNFRERLTKIRSQIVSAGGEDVRIVVASKSQEPKVLSALVEAGLGDFGESFADEFLKKSVVLRSESPDNVQKIDWHFIGQLQTNKVKKLSVEKIKLFQSVDRKSLIDALAKYFPGNDVLIQLNTTSDPKRGGATAKDIPELVKLAHQAGLNPVGIMLVARRGMESSIQDFRLAKRLQIDLGLEVLSAGMSEDFLIAVGEGANMVRLGRVLFSSPEKSLNP